MGTVLTYKQNDHPTLPEVDHG